MWSLGAAAGGGAAVGAAAAARALLGGDALGFSGAARGAAVRGEARGAALLLGTAAAGAACSAGLLPGAVVGTLGLSTGRAAAAGLATGLGTGLANGCTSGHGICGLSRLSPRSLVAVSVFMACGCATAVFSGTPGALGLPPGSGVLPGPEPLSTAAASALAAASLALALGSAAVALAARRFCAGGAECAPLRLLGDLLVGAVAGLGLAVSGMGNPARVAGFLALGQGAAWDPSLLFVMGGAIAVALPGFRFVKALFAKPLVAPHFDLPAISWETEGLARLVGGSALFGVGWGLSGLCPGPMLLQLGGHPTQALGAALVGMVVGFLAVDAVGPARADREKKIS